MATLIPVWLQSCDKETRQRKQEVEEKEKVESKMGKEGKETIINFQKVWDV